MEVTKDVILDLLPLYLAGEVSEDTRSLIENYLAGDEDLAALAKQSDLLHLPGDIPVSLTDEDKMKAYRKTKWMMVLAIVILSIIFALVLGATFYAFFISG
ncbi:MAG: anti-sigma factor family protein [Anaerolineales bacterium]|jgi:hypothetical protein